MPQKFTTPTFHIHLWSTWSVAKRHTYSWIPLIYFSTEKWLAMIYWHGLKINWPSFGSRIELKNKNFFGIDIVDWFHHGYEAHEFKLLHDFYFSSIKIVLIKVWNMIPLKITKAKCHQQTCSLSDDWHSSY